MRAIFSSASASSPESSSSLPIAAATFFSQSSMARQHNRRMVPRAIWRRAPLALVRRPAAFAAVASASLLAALAAASGPLGRAGIESEALKGKLAALTPLAAGLTIERGASSGRGKTVEEIARADAARRAAVERLARA